MKTELLKTNICDEWVCSMETSGTALTLEHSSPHCVAEWLWSSQMSGFNEDGNILSFIHSHI